MSLVSEALPTVANVLSAAAVVMRTEETVVCHESWLLALFLTTLAVFLQGCWAWY